MIPATKFLCFYNDYAATHVGIFCQNSCIDSCLLSNKEASSQLFVACDTLLRKNSLILEDCGFIAAHQGPGPFTTLRVILSAVNGLAYATQLPLIGINGLEAFITHHSSEQFDYTIALLNAFCGDIYYALFDEKTKKVEMGCLPLHELLTRINQIPASKIHYIGNAVSLYDKELMALPTHHTIFCSPNLLYASLEAVGLQAWKNWQNNQVSSSQLPALYLKQSPVYQTIINTNV